MILKNNQGTAIILSLIIVTVLFILTSFLIRKVVTNTMMVRKAKEEQEGYALAKQGILYALDRLNTWEGVDPDYDPTDWLNGQNWDEDNWNPFDLNSDGENDVQIRVDKDDIPHPDDDDPAFDSQDDDNGDLNYITIESQDLPKKLVTLQAITENSSPLLKYVRFINSDVTFSSNTTFGDVNNGAPVHINGNLMLDGDANEIYLKDNQRFEVAGEIISYDSGPAQTDKIKIQPANGASFPNKTLDDDGSGIDGYGFTGTIVNEVEYSQLDPMEFNTVQGHYFDGVHLPSSYDYSEDPDNPQYVSGKRIILWPQIDETRYENLVGGVGTAYYVVGFPSDDESGTWYDITASGWIDDRTGSAPSSGSIDSATYTSQSAILVILDGNGEMSGTAGQVGIDDGEGGGTANNSVIESGEWRSYPTDPDRKVIYSSDNLRIMGIIGDDLSPTDHKLTIVSGGTIYIESNISKGTGGSSLALIAKDWITLNPTHRFINRAVVDYTGSWNNPSYIRGESDNNQMNTSVGSGLTNIAVLDLGQSVTTDKIQLKKLNFPDAAVYLTLKVYGSNDNTANIVAGDEKFGPDYSTTINDDVDFERTGGSYTFRYVKFWLYNIHDSDSYLVYFDAVEIPLTSINAVCFAEDNSWAVISGNISGYSFAVNGGIAENQFEQSSNWFTNWPSITYTHDSSIASPPALPPSVNLVSLKRK